MHRKRIRRNRELIFFQDDKAEYYWSVLEFGVVIRRHAPYVIFTLVIPTVITTFGKSQNARRTKQHALTVLF